jgi:L-seryl-tRNA(Ser) seleniumtransferase
VTLAALQDVALTYSSGDASTIPFWRMATASIRTLHDRAEAIAASVPGLKIVETEATAGGGSLPGLTIPSVGVALEVAAVAPALARLRDRGVVGIAGPHSVVCDLRTVDSRDDDAVRAALAELGS